MPTDGINKSLYKRRMMGINGFWEIIEKPNLVWPILRSDPLFIQCSIPYEKDIRSDIFNPFPKAKTVYTTYVNNTKK